MSKATLKPIISKLREIIIKDIAGKMEKYGFDDAGRIITNKPLSEYDNTIKNNLVSLFKGKNIEGNKKEYIGYIQDSARTFLHILICFKTMEQRGIMGNVIGRLMNDHIYDNIIPDFNSIHPLAYIDLCKKCEDEIIRIEKKDNSEEDREYYGFIFMLSALAKEMAKEVPLLFKDYEHNLVHPDFEGLKEILYTINKIESNEYDEDDFLGWIYQYWVDVKPDEIKKAESDAEISYGNMIFLDILKNLEEEQTRFGEFYTPRWVVKHIVDKAISKYYEENGKVDKIKLLDPACGAGNFLVYSFDVFYELYKKEYPDWADSKIIMSILENNIYGVDILLAPLQITGLNLWLKAKSKAGELKIINLNLFNINVLRANSLYKWEDEPEDSYQLSLFDYELEFTEKKYTAEDIGRYISSHNIYAKREAKKFFSSRFEVIVMNPPFVDTRNMNEDTKKFIKEYYPKNSRNFVSAFIERSMELIKKNGYIGFVASDTFKTLVSFTNLRNMILDKTSLLEIVDLGYGVFEADVSCGIYFLKSQSNKSNKTFVYNCKKTDKKQIYDLIDEIRKNEISPTQLKQITFKEYQDSVFLTDMPKYMAELYTDKKCLGLGCNPIAECRVGLKIGNNEELFTRYIWEIPRDFLQSRKFVPISKSNSESYIRDYHDVLYWDSDGKGIRENEGCLWQNSDFYFRKGLSYNLGGRIFKVRKLPAGVLFTQGSSGIFINDEYLHLEDYLLGILKSKVVNYFLIKINPTNNTTPNDVKKIPVIIEEFESVNLISEYSKAIQNLLINKLKFDTLSEFFEVHPIDYFLSGSIESAAMQYIDYIENSELQIDAIQSKLDEAVYRLYQISEDEKNNIENEFGKPSHLYPVIEDVVSVSDLRQLYLIGDPVKNGRSKRPLSILEIASIKKINPISLMDLKVKNKIYREKDIKKIVLDYIRYIVKCELAQKKARLYIDDEIEIIIKSHLEEKIINGYTVVHEIEAILGKTITDVIKSGINYGSQIFTLAGNGSKDVDEPFIQQKVLSGTGSNKQVVIWHLSHFLLEFEEDKKYVMQNEIRRLSNEVYRPRLQTIKEKLQGIVSGAEKKELEKQEKLLSEAVKTLEAWKVVN